jgi:hypothetical protein
VRGRNLRTLQRGVLTQAAALDNPADYPMLCVARAAIFAGAHRLKPNRLINRVVWNFA